MNAAEQIPPDFDWVTARAAWSLEVAFEALVSVATRDVEAMKNHTTDKIILNQLAPNAFLVGRRSDLGGGMTSPAGTVRFRRDETHIAIENLEGGKVEHGTAVTPVLLHNGAKKLEAIGHIKGTFEPWQLSRVFLEPLFFPTA